ncbi:MAG: Smr/MutS family protein, partial [bacterium]|nr:Smr/MutS family protein [bacterium]
LYFLQARHPLIPSSQVVPIDVRLGSDFHVLLITGPNTGGKTVTLKTIGLLTLMAQSGLHIPAGEGSTVAVFGELFADIGDEQSIEQSLSTFSSHMTNIKKIVDEADHTSLVLLDELGAGTDPTEGAALAMSIIDTFLRRGTRVVATTHYSELKAYAHTHSMIQNASMEFSVETLSPTFALSIGLPGKSNAFEISQRLGLDMEVIKGARKYLSSEVLKVEDLIRSLEESHKDVKKVREEAYMMRSEAELLIAKVENKERQLKEKEQSILKNATAEARALINRGKKELDLLLGELKKAQDSNSNVEIQKAAERARQGIRTISESYSLEEEPLQNEASSDIGEVQLGDEVVILHLKQRGQILDISSSGVITVQVGSMRVSTERKQLLKVDDKKGRAKESTINGRFNIVDLSRNRVSTELDLRGHTIDEAIIKVDKYLDDAFVAGLPVVRLIHGKGTGALRKGMTEYLR